jgi:hypothetical protein
MRYSITSYPTMTLSAGGSRLILYNYRYRNPPAVSSNWLTILNSTTLKSAGKPVQLVGCGVSQVATAGSAVIVLCVDDMDARLVDIRRNKVVARIKLPSHSRYGTLGRAVALAVSPTGHEAYVVTNDMKLIAIDTRRHRITGLVNSYQTQYASVPTLDSVALLASSNELAVGTSPKNASGNTATVLKVFRLPSLRLAGSAKLPSFSHLIATRKGELYTFPMIDSPPYVQNGEFSKLTIVWHRGLHVKTTKLLALGGIVYRIAVP